MLAAILIATAALLAALLLGAAIDPNGSRQRFEPDHLI